MTAGVWLLTGFLFLGGGILAAQDSAGGDFSVSRGSIPGELLRPRREESPRYPVDTVIGELGRGEASAEAYRFAREVAAALLAGNMSASSLNAMNRVLLETYLSSLEVINPRNFRLGGGREEDDGAVSFLVRFFGREQGITGELFIRLKTVVEKPAEVKPEETGEGEDTPPETIAGQERTFWIFEDLILEEARSREAENEKAASRFDFPPYERFF